MGRVGLGGGNTDGTNVHFVFKICGFINMPLSGQLFLHPQRYNIFMIMHVAQTKPNIFK